MFLVTTGLFQFAREELLSIIIKEQLFQKAALRGERLSSFPSFLGDTIRVIVQAPQESGISYPETGEFNGEENTNQYFHGRD